MLEEEGSNRLVEGIGNDDGRGRGIREESYGDETEEKDRESWTL